MKDHSHKPYKRHSILKNLILPIHPLPLLHRRPPPLRDPTTIPSICRRTFHSGRWARDQRPPQKGRILIRPTNPPLAASLGASSGSKFEGEKARGWESGGKANWVGGFVKEKVRRRRDPEKGHFLGFKKRLDANLFHHFERRKKRGRLMVD